MIQNGVPNYCPSCHRNFISRFSAIIEQTGAIVAGNIEQCPNPACRAPVPVPEGTTIMYKGRPRFVKAGTTVTPRNPVAHELAVVKEAVFSTGVGTPHSLVWHLMSGKRGDVYLRTREFPFWKLSVHQSGQDNIGYTEEAWKSGVNKRHPEGAKRHLYQADRRMPALGMLTRVARVIVTGDIADHPSGATAPLKPKYEDKLRLFPPKPSEPRFMFDVVFSEGHPAEFAETYPGSALWATIRGPGNEHISVMDGFSSPMLPGDEDFASSLREENNLPSPYYGKTILEFGITPKNTFIVKVHHKNFNDSE